MFDLGMQELVVIFVVALVVFGPKRLPELGKAIGKTMGQLRNAVSGVRSEVEREIRAAETDLNLEEMPAWKKRDAGSEAAPPEEESGKSEKEKPQDEKPEGEEPQDEKPEGEEPQDEKPEGEEPTDEAEQKGEGN